MAKITILTQYYPPEIGSAADLMNDVARAASELGHSVQVIAALPNYPGGVVFPPYKGRVVVKEQREATVVHRVWLAAAPPTGKFRRLRTYGSFAVSGLLAGLLSRFKPDIVLADSPPLTTALSAAALARLRRTRLVLNIEDLWPEAVAQIGAISRGRLFSLATASEEWAYREAVLIAGQTEGIVSSIRARVPTARVMLLPAGVDPSRFTTDGDTQLVRKPGANGVFKIGYAGLHGLWQALDSVLDAAALLLDYQDIKFEFIGDGPTRRHLQHRATAERLRNVQLLPPQARTVVDRRLASWAAGVVPLIDVPMMQEALPVKLYEVMAAGVPVIFSGPTGEATNLISRVGCGIAVPPCDGGALADAILELRDDPERATALGARGRAAAVEAFDRRSLFRDFVAQAVAAD